LTLGISQLMSMDMKKIGVLAIAFSLIAMGWNYYYNILFDRFMLKKTGGVHKTTLVRVLHALIFELGLLTISLPIMAWWLNISLISAFALDMGIVVFYLVYAFVYNLVYDYVFPIPAAKA